MRSFLRGEGVLLPQIPSRVVISAGLIIIVIVPILLADQNQPWDARVLALILVMLFACVEIIEQYYFDEEETRTVAIFFLAARIILATLAIQVNVSPLTALLSALIPFNAYFVFGSRTSNFLALGYIITSFIRVDANVFTLVQRDSLTSWLLHNVVIMFLLFFARALHRDREQQDYTEQLLADLRTSHRELQAYALQVGELAAVEERNRLARDIHDSVGHYLTGVNIQLERGCISSWCGNDIK